MAVNKPAAAAAPVAGIVTVPFRDLDLWDGNPRRRVDPDAVAELADSIAAKNILQNLVARPDPAGGAGLQVVAGQQRWKAVAHLIATGRADGGFPVPVRVEALSDREALELGLAENVQRRNMTPLDEADAYARDIAMGATIDSLAALTGISRRTIVQRLGLHHRLSARVRAALDAGTIDIGRAEAFTLGEKERQDELLDALLRQPRQYDTAEIRRLLTEKLIPLGRAIFDRAQYTGALVRDLFLDEDYAEDIAQFRRLQVEAARARAAELGRTWRWVDVVVGGKLEVWNYRRGVGADEGGAIVHVRDDLRVETHTGLQKPAPAPDPAPRHAAPAANGAAHPAVAAAAQRTDTAPAAPARPSLSRAHLVWARQQKTAALQQALADCPEVAVSCALLGLLVAGAPELRFGPAVAQMNSVDRADGAGRARTILLERLPLEIAQFWEARGDRNAVLSIGPAHIARIFAALAAMDPGDRRALFAACVAPWVGTWPSWPELGDSPLVCAIAAALGLAAAPFALTTGYLERLSKPRLAAIAREFGIADDEFDIAGASRDALIDRIALAVDHDPAWRPPELRFASAAEIAASLAEGA